MKPDTKQDLKTAATLTDFIIKNKDSVFYGDKLLKLFLNSYNKRLNKLRKDRNGQER